MIVKRLISPSAAPLAQRRQLDLLIEQYVDRICPLVVDLLYRRQHNATVSVPQELQVEMSVLYALGERSDFSALYDAIGRHLEVAGIDPTDDNLLRFTSMFDAVTPCVLNPIHNFVDVVINSGRTDALDPEILFAPQAGLVAA